MHQLGCPENADLRYLVVLCIFRFLDISCEPENRSLYKLAASLSIRPSMGGCLCHGLGTEIHLSFNI